LRYTLLLINDGRYEYGWKCLMSALAFLPKPERIVAIDDDTHELGFAGAIQSGWDQILATDTELIFHLEADFVFERAVDLEAMASLALDPHVSQVALKRQPWNPQEHEAGGIVELDPAAFEEGQHGGHAYTAHRKFFTTNPSLYRRDIAERGWPQEDRSEGKFSIDLFEDPHVVSTFWGRKFDPPMVTHIGDTRAGKGY
jgi:hypothetical protein